MFGSQNKPFGTATPFGASANTSGFGSTGFGSQPGASTSLFGGTNTSSQSGTGSIFGGSGTFGQTSQSSGFSFGGAATPQTASGGGLFGSNTTQQSIFGTPTTNNAFGAKTPANFGTSNAGGSLFAQPTSSSSLFGTSTTSSTSLFGGGTVNKGFGQASSGTTVKYNPPTGQDTMMKGGISTNINTRHQCITAMKDYESKSLEELRTEDYLANRKGPQAGGGTTTGLFGSGATNPQTTQSSFNFGSNKSSGFGGGTSLFGQPQQQQQQSTGLFGSGNQSSSSLFGTTTTTSGSTATSGFGGFGTNTSGTSLFGGGNTQGKSLFGSTQTTQSGGTGLFGSTQTSTSGFGGFGGFGQQTQQNQQSGLFKSATGGFGATSTGNTGFGFGGNTNTTGGGGLFGNKTATSGSGFTFGQQSSAPGFGTTQNNTLFGNKGTTGFGTTNNQIGGASGGLFGGLGGGINTGGSLFLNPQNKSAFNMGSAFGTGSTFGSTGTNTLGGNLGQATTNGNNQQAAEMAALQQQLTLLSNNPYGDSALFRNIPSRSEKREDILKPTNPAAQRAALNTSASQYKVSPRPAPKIKVKPLQSLMNTKSQLFDGLEDDDSSFGNDTFTPRRSIKKLVIGKQSPNSSVLSQSQAAADEDLVAPSTGYPRDSPVVSKQQTSTVDDMDNLENDIIKGNKAIPDSLMQSPMRPSPDDTISDLNSASGNRASSSRSPSQLRTSDHVTDHNEEESVIQDHPAGIILTRSEYFTIPTLDELAEMVDENGDCHVENFTVGRELYGNVFFPGITNVANMNLDEIVHFRRKEVTLYPDDSEKPPVGEGLNKVAQVTLDCVWPNDKSNHSPIKSPDRLVKIGYQNKLEQATAKMGAKFIDYRPDTGSWVFEVKHFSKYGLLDDDEDEPVETEAKKIKQQLKDESLQQHKVQKKPVLLEKEPSQLERPLADRWRHQDLSQSEMSPSEMLQQQHRPDQVMEDGGAAGASSEDDHGMIQQMTMPDEAGAMAAFEEDFGEMEPSSHRLAQHFGINAHSVQVMKASFFGEEEDYGIESQSSQRQQQSSYIDLRDQRLDSSEMGRSLFTGGDERQDRSLHTSMSVSYHQEPEADRSIFGSATSRHPTLRLPLQSMPEQLRYPSISVHPQPPRSKVVGSCIQRRVTPLSESIMCDQHRSLLDAGLFMGRRFRVGWGPNWSLSHSGEPALKQPSTEEVETRHTSLLHGISAQQTLDKSPYQVCLEKMDGKLFQEDTDSSLQAMTEGLLEIALNNSCSTDEDGCPFFVSKPGVDALHKYAELSQEQLQKIGDLPEDHPIHHADVVWSLAAALWGRLEGSQSQGDEDELSYHSVMARREALSRWLTSTSQPTVNNEVEQAKFQGDDHIPAVFSLLTGRQVAEACTLAQQSGDHRLALLMSQAAGSGCGRQQLSHQLNSWGSRKTDQFIAAERLKIFSLLSGNMVWRGSKQEVNVCQDLDWKRCLALHLWYHCPPSATIPDALAAYDKAFRDDGYAAPPVPPYLEKNTGLCEETNNEFKKYDMCYHLLKLYSERSYRLDHTLAPSASTPNPLDAKLSWHLGQVLQALAYSHLSEHHDASLCSSYAAQLEGMGLWHWAVFVMLHIKDPARRRSCIQELLYRHVSLSEDDERIPEEDFLTDKLDIPATWIHQAKAVLAHHRGDHAKEAYHLLHAGRWSQCHHVLIRHLAADAFIEEEFSYLDDFLSEMSPHAAGIQDWETGGKIYHDFIQLQSQLEQIQEGQISGYEVERLQTQVHSLSRRMGRLQCFTAKHRLCQAELCKRLSVLIRTLHSIQDPDNRQALASLLATVKLPMPEDYALQELRNITMDFMNALPTRS